MNCPDCHCPRERPMTVATNSLITRCHNAFHAALPAPPAHAEPVSVSPVGPEDFVRPGANADADSRPRVCDCGHHRSHHPINAPGCAYGGCDCVGFFGVHWKSSDLQKSTESTEAARGLPDPQTYKAQPDKTLDPFDPNPPKLIPADNGWRYCSACEQPVEARGHECAGRFAGATWEELNRARLDATSDYFTATCRAEDAEERAEYAESLLCAMAFDHGTAQTHIAPSGHRGLVTCRGDGPLGCPFCDAARGGGA